MIRKRPLLNRPLPYLTRNPLLYWLVLSLLAVLFGFGLQVWLTARSQGNKVAHLQWDVTAAAMN